jgi:hypothetical protein
VVLLFFGTTQYLSTIMGISVLEFVQRPVGARLVTTL